MTATCKRCGKLVAGRATHCTRACRAADYRRDAFRLAARARRCPICTGVAGAESVDFALRCVCGATDVLRPGPFVMGDDLLRRVEGFMERHKSCVPPAADAESAGPADAVPEPQPVADDDEDMQDFIADEMEDD